MPLKVRRVRDDGIRQANGNLVAHIHGVTGQPMKKRWGQRQIRVVCEHDRMAKKAPAQCDTAGIELGNAKLPCSLVSTLTSMK